uniref:Uncharacterized protein n=1 Tax=Setaria viridis TaxID=4556 RepID=A0A4U6T900_SETVI|nr:hypothetical protein SEVIR_9G557200v2 [Setaria viridis]
MAPAACSGAARRGRAARAGGGGASSRVGAIASLGAAGLAQSVRVSLELMLSSLRIMAKDRAHKKQWSKIRESVRRSGSKQWSKIRESVRRSGSFVQVKIEAEANSEFAMAAEIQEAFADVAALMGSDAGVVLHLKSHAAPSAAAMAKLVGVSVRIRDCWVFWWTCRHPGSSSARQVLAGHQPCRDAGNQPSDRAGHEPGTKNSLYSIVHLVVLCIVKEVITKSLD